jgi:hypothetical protein
LYGSNEAEPQQVPLHQIRLTISLTNSISRDDDRNGAIQRKNGNRNLSRKEVPCQTLPFEATIAKAIVGVKLYEQKENLKLARPARLTEKLHPSPYFLGCADLLLEVTL